jgi:hypothetical protein
VTNFDYEKKDKKNADGEDLLTAKEHEYGNVRNYVAVHENSSLYEMWSGHKPGNRISIGVYAVVASLIIGIMVMVLSALTLLWHAVTLIMVILLPLIATISIHPTQQKLLRGWWQTFVHSFVLRAGFGVILTILLLFYQLILPLQVPLGMQLLMLLLVTVAVVMLLKNLLSGKFSPQVAGAEDALGVADMAAKVAVGAPGVAGGGAKTSGRVVASSARGVAWTADRVVAKGRGREKLQQWGWIGQSKREQQQTAKRQAETTKKANEKARGDNQSPPEQELPAAPTRGRRVSGSSGQRATQPPAPSEPRPTTVPQQPTWSQPQAQPHPQPQPQPPAPRPRPTPADPPAVPRQQASPTPPQRDPRNPNGRV